MGMYFYWAFIVASVSILIFEIINFIRIFINAREIRPVVKIKGISGGSVYFSIMCLIEMYIGFLNLKLYESNLSRFPEELQIISSYFHSTIICFALAALSIALALSSFDYSFVTNVGLFVKGNLIKWQDILEWDWKEYHISVLRVKYNGINKRGESKRKIKTSNINVSMKQDDEIEKLLKEYMGEKFVDRLGDNTLKGTL